MESTKIIKQEAAQAKRCFWQKHIEAWQTSGLTQRDYCTTHDLKHHQFLYWRRRHRSDNTSERNKHAGFLPVELVNGTSANNSTPDLIIETTNGIRIHIGHDFDADTLRRVLTVLTADKC